MSRAALVQSYLDGQLGRRAFIRRLIATGVSAAAVLSYASLLEAAPAGAVAADFYLVMQSNSFVISPALLQQGQGVEFANHDSIGHNARDTSGLGLFNTHNVVPEGSHLVGPPPGAGIFPYKCDAPATTHPLMNGRLKVPVVATPSQAALGSTFLIRWAVDTPPTGYVFDVQRRRPGHSQFDVWRTGVTNKAANVHPSARGPYAFRARVRRPANGATSFWSANATIQVT